MCEVVEVKWKVEKGAVRKILIWREPRWAAAKKARLLQREVVPSSSFEF